VLRLGLLVGLRLRRGPKDVDALVSASGAGVPRTLLPGVLPGPDIVKSDEKALWLLKRVIWCEVG